MHKFQAAWKSYNPDMPPFVLPGDEVLLHENNLICRYNGWKGFVSHPDWGAPGNTGLHLDLLPMPFVGNVESASVFLLMLNPGFGPTDYFGEYQVPKYRSALIDNLHQANGTEFLSLDPKFSWHGGFNYWHTKLRNLIAVFSHQCSLPYSQGLRLFRSNIAAIELIPYHSENFALPGRIRDKLPSVCLARDFTHDILKPRARSGDCLIVVTRAVKQWHLPNH
ncbi:MAG: hypothetical protein KKE86_08360, partial [Planctomycetes bacterium]|nr:hypothetical protein [Planctomycetota bacterium]